MAESSTSLHSHRKQNGSTNGSRSTSNSKATAKRSSQNTISELIQRLCYNFNDKQNDKRMKSMYQKATQFMSTHKSEPVTREELYYCDKIKSYLEQYGGDEASITFDNNMRKLENCNYPKHRNAVLHLLVALADSNLVADSSEINESVASSSSIASNASGDFKKPFIVPPFDQLQTVLARPSDCHASKKVNTILPFRPASKQEFVSLPAMIPNGVHHGDQSRHSASVRDERSSVLSGSLPRSMRITDQPMVTETMLVRDLLYAFQGVNGKVLKFDPIVDGYNLDAKMNVPRRLRNMTLKLAELGWLHNELRTFCANWAHAKSVGIVRQSLVSALRNELTEYYRQLAHLQSQVQYSAHEGVSDTALTARRSDESLRSLSAEVITLRSLVVWTAEPLQRMTWLVNVAHACQSARGGGIASVVHGFLQHGDPAVRELVTNVLSAVCKPILRMLSSWVLDGELDDLNGEFFIAGNSEITGDRLWHEKYRVQESMVPSFIPMAQAQKILATGKSINFLREVCKDQQELFGREQLRLALESTTVEALFRCDSDLTAMLDTAYLQTSKRVIDVLTTQHRFMDHLQAMRNFLLLGQGDFIRYLIEIMEPELRKPGAELFPHNLSSILETAIRATNAQYEPADVLNRLDVRVLDRTPGDIGWDIFTLDYHVKGPIGTVFAPTMTSYLVLFQHLWKAKRIEWILSLMWKKQVAASKMLRNIPELAPVLQQINLVTSEMIHFVHQMQYYLLFEVVEISWDDLKREVLAAESLDDIITAHNHFLLKIKKGALLDHKSMELSVQLRAMFETVLQVQDLVDRLHEAVNRELEARTAKDKMIEDQCNAGQFGITEAQQDAYDEARRVFVHKTLPNFRHTIKTNTSSYQTCVRKLLLRMNEDECHSLQLLSFRLDFNGHYKNSDPRLSASVTYQHRRLSEMGLQRHSEAK